MGRILAAFLFLIPFVLGAQPTKRYATVNQRRAFYMDLANQHGHPLVAEILRSDTKNQFEAYVDGYTELELLKAYGTVVHETLHGFNSFEGETHTYLDGEGRRVKVQVGKYFNSKELNRVVPASVQDSIFRYGLYVGGKDIVAGQKVGVNSHGGNQAMSVLMGIYGLVEEFDAYYYDALASYHMRSFYNNPSKGYDEEQRQQLDRKLELSMVALYEFRFFIASYLRHAQTKHPDIFAELMANKELRLVCRSIDTQFEALGHDVAAYLEGRLEENTVKSVQELKFDGSDEDFMKFCGLTGLDPNQIFREETKVVNGKKITKWVCLLDDDDIAEVRKAYVEFGKQLKAANLSGPNMFYADAPGQIAYLKRLMTAELQAVLDGFKG